MTEWETEEEILRSIGNGQYEDYIIVSRDEADRRVAELEVQLAEAQKDSERLRSVLWSVRGNFDDVLSENVLAQIDAALAAGGE